MFGRRRAVVNTGHDTRYLPDGQPGPMRVPRRLCSRQERPSRARFVPSPSEPLVGGAAEAFDQQIQKLFRNGQRQVTVDLSAVSTIDEAGIRALVRGATSAQRVGGLFRLAAVRPAVARALELSDLSSAFEMYDSVAAARIASWPWRAIRLTAGGFAVCGALVWAGLRWPVGLAGVMDATRILASGRHADAVDWFQPFIELLKLVAASLIGLLITAVHRPDTRDTGPHMGQAQTLLCVSGAVMMIIIGNSLARAFGIAGAASIIRFRTPVDDPKDVTVLFLLMGLGMSIGLGAFAVAGLGAAFLCVRSRVEPDVHRPRRVSCRSSSRHTVLTFRLHMSKGCSRVTESRSSRAILTARIGVKNHKSAPGSTRGRPSRT